MSGSEVYFSEGVYERLKADPAAMSAVLDAPCRSRGSPRFSGGGFGKSPGNPKPHATRRPPATSRAAAATFIVKKPYWLLDGSPAGKTRAYGTGHGTPYNYDQHVPVFFMGFGIQPGEYFAEATPADIAPTLAALTGVTLATRDGRVLADALESTDPAG